MTVKKDILIYFDLITSLKTTQEVADFTSEIDTLLLAFFKSEETSIEKALTLISADSARKIMQTFAKNNLNIHDKEIVSDFFETLKRLLKKFKVIKLILAFDPTRKTIENIHNFVKDALGIGYLLDIEISRDILGGAIVVYNGKYNDYSLRKTLEETFETKKQEIQMLIQ